MEGKRRGEERRGEQRRGEGVEELVGIYCGKDGYLLRIVLTTLFCVSYHSWTMVFI